MTTNDPFEPDAPVEMPAVPDVPGPDHRADDGKPNAFLRTIVQVGPAAAVFLLVVLPEVLQMVVDSFGESLPAGLYGALVAITAGITLIAGILAKVMALPSVQGWLAKYVPMFAATKATKK